MNCRTLRNSETIASIFQQSHKTAAEKSEEAGHGLLNINQGD
jgi:hypothetical protein